MRHLIIILLIYTTGQCYGGTFDLDTIDNWQIFNGSELVFGGHDSPLGVEFHGTIRTTDLEELIVQFNHCRRYTDEFDVTLEVMDENGKSILTKEFKNNAGTRMSITRKEFGLLTVKSMTIRYKEQRKNGTDRILGRISFL